MSTPIIFVELASHIAKRPGFGTIELCAHGAPEHPEESLRARRMLARATLLVAAELEGIAGAELLECDVSVPSPSRGIINVDFRSDGFGCDAIDEMLMEACGNCGFWPLDMLASNGDIDPTAEVAP